MEDGKKLCKKLSVGEASSSAIAWPHTFTQTQREHIYTYYRELGFSIIPLKRGTKRPALTEVVPYRTRMPTEDEFNKWFVFSRTPVNVAAVLGPVSVGRLIALDVDGPAAKARVERKLVEMGYCNLRTAIIHTFMTRTGSGSGYQLLFKVEDPELFHEMDLRTKTLWWGEEGEHEEIKFLGQNALAVLAPSLHPSGGVYVWNYKAPCTITKAEIKQLFETFSEKYVATTLDDSSSSSIHNNNNNQTLLLLSLNTRRRPSSLSPHEIQKLIAALKPRYRRGKRHTITLGYSGFLRKCGYSLQAVEEFCVIVCQTFNDEESESRLHDVRDTFRKPIKTGREIAGWSLLNDLS